MTGPDAARRGSFIVFEGGEGVGKTTQIQRLADTLTSAGEPPLVTREPGGSTIGRQIRRILLDPDTGIIDHRAEALLFAADRAEHVASIIRPALTSGTTVLCDRYMDSSAAYQGSGRGLSRDEVINLSMWATNNLVPDLTILLDLDPASGLARCTRDEFGSADRIEAEASEFLHAVRDGFLDLASRNPDRYLIVNADQPADDIAALVWDRVEALLPVPVR